MADAADQVESFGVVHLAALLNTVRLAIAASSNGESAEIGIPLTEGPGRFRYGSRTLVLSGAGLVTRYGYRIVCGAMRSEETLILGQILGDDVLEDAGPEGSVLAWELGENFQAAAEIASAFSGQWMLGSSLKPDSSSRGSIMSWISRRLGDDRISEAVTLDGSQRLSVLVPGEIEPPVQIPLINGGQGKGIYALPPLALHRLSLEEPMMMGGEPITALAIQPRGPAVRWRDRLGRMVYVVPAESKGLVIRGWGLLNPVVLDEFPDFDPPATPGEEPAG